MEKKKFPFSYFSKGEIILWSVGVVLITASFFIFKSGGVLSLVASLIGITALIFNAKGNPIGQALMIVFAVIYGIISYSFAYYGEMITYLCMSAPMAAVSLISWLKNPFDGKRSQVKVNRIKSKELFILIPLTCAVTVLFYFILKFLGTANLLPSTFSVTTSFAAVYLVFRRSEYFALAYAFNDAVLIVLWILAAVKDSSYISVIICFALFLVNDLYSFINWKRMRKLQAELSKNRHLEESKG